MTDTSPVLSVLVVEDDWLLRDAVVGYLRDAGCHVLEAASGELALSPAFDGARIDVVFTDIQLGGRLDGWDVGEALKGARPGISVIYTSGCYGTRPRPVAGSRSIDKPYLPEVVLDACRGLCNGQARA